MGSMVLGAAEGFTVRHYMEAAGGGRLDICHLFGRQVYIPINTVISWSFLERKVG